MLLEVPEWQREAPLVCIVDDDESIRESVGSLVRAAGFRAAVFPSAEVFLYSDNLVDTKCLILDIGMPGLSGLDLQRRLAKMRCSIPIIFATAYDDDLSRTRAFEQGAIAFLHKPFNDNALLEAMHSALE
jgi:FixJ family two-component response regulator